MFFRNINYFLIENRIKVYRSFLKDSSFYDNHKSFVKKFLRCLLVVPAILFDLFRKFRKLEKQKDFFI